MICSSKTKSINDEKNGAAVVNDSASFIATVVNDSDTASTARCLYSSDETSADTGLNRSGIDNGNTFRNCDLCSECDSRSSSYFETATVVNGSGGAGRGINSSGKEKNTATGPNCNYMHSSESLS